MDGPPELINANPVLHARSQTARRPRVQAGDGEREPIDAQEVFEHVRDVTDPEHPYSLEQLNVVSEELIHVDDARGTVRCVRWLAAGCWLAARCVRPGPAAAPAPCACRMRSCARAG